MTGPVTGEHFAEAWRANHAYLVDLSFRMLGDVGAAEDVVQEAFTRLARMPVGEVEDDRGWLTVVTSRLCLDQIRSARNRRERADTEAVAETSRPLAQAPAVDPADRITLDDDVRLALFVVLQRLSPPERVAFVLHDVFQTPFEDIATTLGRSAATCRQLARRARQKIGQTPVRPNDVARAEHREVTEKFITACGNGDLDALLSVLHPDAWGVAEFGTGQRHRLGGNEGAEHVARTLLHYYGTGTTLVSHPLGAEPTVLAYLDRTLYAVLTLSVADDRVVSIHALVDPAAMGRILDQP